MMATLIESLGIEYRATLRAEREAEMERKMLAGELEYEERAALRLQLDEREMQLQYEELCDGRASAVEVWFPVLRRLADEIRESPDHSQAHRLTSEVQESATFRFWSRPLLPLAYEDGPEVVVSSLPSWWRSKATEEELFQVAEVACEVWRAAWLDDRCDYRAADEVANLAMSHLLGAIMDRPNQMGRKA